MKSIYDGLQFSTQEVNLDFRIKVYGSSDGQKYNTLVGVSGLIRLLGIELTNKILNQAYNNFDAKVVCKLRRGLKITFYQKLD